MNQIIHEKLQVFVENTVKSDRQIRNCMLLVSSGDERFHWTGAAGLADEEKCVKISTETPFFLASITKLFTAVVVMQLYEDGLLNLNDNIVDYLPGNLVNGIHIYKGIDYTNRIQIQHLLSHTSGIADYYTKAPKGERSFMDILLAEPDREWTVEDTIVWAREKLEPSFAPGEKAEYSDTNFQLLGFIIEKVTGKALHDVYLEYIFGPAGMKHSCLYTRSEPIEAAIAAPAHLYYKDLDLTFHKAYESSWADGGIISTMEDCLKFFKTLNSGKLIKDKTNIDMMHQWRPIFFPIQYGFGTMYYKLSRLMSPFFAIPGVWGHSGSTGSFLFYCEEQDLYLVGSINQAKNPGKPFQMMAKILNVTKNL
ncbi:MAG: beta-lactamase family protein [Anaerolineaceae bacterium]|nr:beta-lactamase family protein [Anaerolineaceae bacterium]